MLIESIWLEIIHLYPMSEWGHYCLNGFSKKYPFQQTLDDDCAGSTGNGRHFLIQHTLHPYLSFRVHRTSRDFVLLLPRDRLLRVVIGAEYSVFLRGNKENGILGRPHHHQFVI